MYSFNILRIPEAKRDVSILLSFNHQPDRCKSKRRQLLRQPIASSRIPREYSQFDFPSRQKILKKKEEKKNQAKKIIIIKKVRRETADKGQATVI